MATHKSSNGGRSGNDKSSRSNSENNGKNLSHKTGTVKSSPQKKSKNMQDDHDTDHDHGDM